MTELEILKRQRHELDKKIRDFENRCVVISGKAKFERGEYWSTPSWWAVSLEVDGSSPIEEKRKKHWQKIIVRNGKEEAIKEIPKIIKDLDALYKRLSKEETENE